MSKSLNKRRFLLYAFVSLFVNAVQSQAVQMGNEIYLCGFEDGEDLSGWKFENGTNKNAWLIGDGISCDGNGSLYISADGVTPGHDETPGYVAVYQDFILKPNTSYRISFDWYNPGYAGGLYVCWMPADYELDRETWSGTNTQSLPRYVVENYKKWSGVELGGDSVMQGAARWEHAAFELPRNAGTPYRLLFFWISDKAQEGDAGGCIDNIQLGEIKCDDILGLKYEMTDSGQGCFSWNLKYGGNSISAYELKYRKDEGDWSEVIHLDKPEAVLPSIMEQGVYDVAVRMVCGNDTSLWYYYNVFVSLYGESCIDYLNYNSEDVIARYGNFPLEKPDDPSNYQVGVIDLGPASSASRITTHYNKREYDVRTGKKLKVVPDDCSAVVRLGNWDINNGTESVTYYYTVDESTPLLLLRYALVLQNPEDHERTAQPRFKLEIRDENGDLINGSCGKEDFYSVDGDDWNEVADGGTRWKDWTSFGVNLQPYIGQRISITLTTFDCGYSGHYGYAYFTLNCARAEIKGAVCESSDKASALEAPDGYLYKWYPKDDPSNVVSTDRVFEPSPENIGIYVCEMTYKDGCSFSLEASVTPRLAKSQFEQNITYKDCQAIVELKNTSYSYREEDTNDRGECTSFIWEYGDGQITRSKDLQLTYTEGGRYPVTLTAELVSGVCSDEFTDTIEIPEFAPNYEKLDANICQGESYGYNGIFYSTSGVYEISEKNEFDCDNVVELNLQVNDTFHVWVEKDLLLYKEPYYEFNGVMLTETGIYTDTLSSACGCDSIVTLDLRAYPALSVDVSYDESLCQEDEKFLIDYAVRSGSFSTYSLLFDETAKTAGFEDRVHEMSAGDEGVIEILIPEGVRPYVYWAKLIFEDEYGGDVMKNIPITINYSSTILVQKWNDVIALLNSQYNGGYEFTAYQWYKNGSPIEGETMPNLYLPDGLDTTAEYQVLLTNANGVALFTCPLIPEVRYNVNVYPNVVNSGESVSVEIPTPGVLSVWNVMGLKMEEVSLEPVMNDVVMPLETGTYLLQVRSESGSSRMFTVLVK